MRNYNQEILSDCVSEEVEEDAIRLDRTLEWLNIFLGYHGDPKQALRMRRYFMAAGTSVLAIGLMVACYLLGALSSAAFYQSVTLILMAILAFYVVFRSGLNLRFSDPNLAVQQILASSLVTLYAMYAADWGRAAFLLLLLMSYLFSVLQLTRRELLIYAAFILGAYGGLIGLLWRFKPQSLDLRLELLQWLVLAFTLPWFALMGGYISGLRKQAAAARATLVDAIESLNEAFCLFDAEDRLVLCNRKYAQTFTDFDRFEDIAGMRFEDLVRSSLARGEVIEPEFQGDVEAWVTERIRRHRNPAPEPRVLQLGGGRWLQVTEQHTRNGGIVGVRRDISTQKQIEQRQAMEYTVTLLLAESETIGDAAPKIIQTICETLGWDCGACWHWDMQDQLLRIAESWSIASTDVKEFVALSSQRRPNPGAGGLIDRVWTTREPIWIADVLVEPGFLRASIAAKAGLRGAFAFPILIGAELYGVMEFYIRDVRQSDHALLAVMRSIGLQIGQFIARKAAEEQIHHLAHFDGLTGLANRNLFDQLLAHALTKAQRTATPLALLFIDLDGFKQVNDRMGHDAGDRLLAAFAQRLRDCLRKSDVGARFNTLGTPARLGGDEFVVLIDDFAEPSQLVVVAQRILATTGIPFLLGDAEGHVTASIGISVYPEDGIDIESLAKNADSAMYCAKQAGKNGYRFFSAEIN